MSPKLDNIDITDIENYSNFIHIPLCYQETEFTCGVACTQSVLAYYGIIYSQSALAEVLQSRPILGTDYQSILFFMQLQGFNASMVENIDINDIKKYINEGVTPILTIQAYKDDEIDYPYDWKNAHYVVACGYYEQGLFVMDPYMLGNYTYLPFTDLLARWHAVDKSGIRHMKSALIIQSEGAPVKYNYKEIKYLK